MNPDGPGPWAIAGVIASISDRVEEPGAGEEEEDGDASPYEATAAGAMASGLNDISDSGNREEEAGADTVLPMKIKESGDEIGVSLASSKPNKNGGGAAWLGKP